MSSPHSNSIGPAQQCTGLHFSFPSATGLFFEENTKHIVAWQAPASFGKLVLFLVKSDDSVNPIVLGTYLAKKGASEELALKSNNQQRGQYHYRIQSGSCIIDSVDFAIVQQQGDSRHSNNDNTVFDNLTQTFKGPHYDPLAHSNDLEFDNLVSSISKSTHDDDHQNKAQTASQPIWAEDMKGSYSNGERHRDGSEDVPEWNVNAIDNWKDESWHVYR